jgi:hypothetical protein
VLHACVQAARALCALIDHTCAGMWASKYILFVNFFFVMVLPIWATPGLGCVRMNSVIVRVCTCCNHPHAAASITKSSSTWRARCTGFRSALWARTRDLFCST